MTSEAAVQAGQEIGVVLIPGVFHRFGARLEAMQDG